VTLETPISDIHKWSGAIPSGRVNTLINRKGRVDVAFYNRDEKLRGLIEIKRHFGASGSRADVERLIAMLRRYGKDHGGSLRWACIAAVHLTSDTSRKNVETRLRDVLRKFKGWHPDVRFDGYTKAVAAPAEAHRYPNCPTEVVGISVLFRL
jgi:hypothetical protein